MELPSTQERTLQRRLLEKCLFITTYTGTGTGNHEHSAIIYCPPQLVPYVIFTNGRHPTLTPSIYPRTAPPLELFHCMDVVESRSLAENLSTVASPSYYTEDGAVLHQ